MRNHIAHIASLLLAIAVSQAFAVPDAQAQRRGDEDNARQQMLDGQVKSLKEIERAVLPQMKGMTYLGPEFDPETRIYRLKFIRDNHVIFVDVDGRSGRILRQRG